MHRRLTPAIVAAAVTLAVAGCATAPQVRRPAPRWVDEPPASTDRFEYFVASGGDRTGDTAAAEQEAAGSLLTRINQALGVDVTVLTTAQARASLDSYEASVRSEVFQSGSGRIEGFRVADRYVVEDGGRVTVHLLGEYERVAFLTERTARRALLAAREELLLEPQRRAEADAVSGRLGAALQGYLQAAAAAAAAEDGLRIAPVVLERSLTKAADLLEGISLRALSGPEQAVTGRRPDEPVRFGLFGRDGLPLSGVPVEISYLESLRGRPIVRRTSLVTDSDGIVAFAYPRLSVVGHVDVTARLDAASYLPLLQALPDSVRSQRLVIESQLAAIRSVWRLTAISGARDVVTTLLILDTDGFGTPTGLSRTSDGVAQALLEAGFRLAVNHLDPATVAAGSTADAISRLQAALSGEVRRVVLGTATIDGFSDANGMLVKVSANVSVVDLNTGEIIYATSAVKNARSSTAEQALNTAFLQLGRSIGEELRAHLP